MLHVSKNIPLSLGIPREIAPHDLLFAQHFHRIKPFLSLLLYQVHFSETALAQHHVCHEVFRLYLFIEDIRIINLRHFNRIVVKHVVNW